MKKIINILKAIQAKSKNILIWLILIVGFFIILSFTNKKYNRISCNEIVITTVSTHTNDFLTKNDILAIVRNYNRGPIINKRIKDIDIHGIEENLNKNVFIENSEVYTNLNGKLYIEIEHKIPLFRVIPNNGKSYYIDVFGRQMPLSPNYTAKTLIATGNIDLQELNKGSESSLFQIMNHIFQDDFLRSLIGQVYVDKQQEIILIPKVGNINIEFGKAEDIDYKFKKLNILFKKILPAEGWGKYKSASLKFRKQIVLKK